MPQSDPILLIAAGLLCLAALYSAVQILRQSPVEDTPSSGRLWLKGLLLPFGFGLIGARWLLMGLGILYPQGWISRLMFGAAVMSILCGVAASRIRRMPD